jgi:hypothetical protein
MRTRKLWWVVAGLAMLALLAAGAFALWPRPDRVTRENVHRISEGMTRAEVEAILGPPGDYSTGPLREHGCPQSSYHDLAMLMAEVGEGGALWLSDTGQAVIWFDSRGRVMEDPFFSECAREPQGPLDNLLWRANRQWRRWFPEKAEALP